MRKTALRTAGAAVMIAGAFALTACSSDASSPAESSAASSGGFEFEDARTDTEPLSLDAVPQTVVAQSSVAAALWDAGFEVAGAYGELTPGSDGTLNYQAGSLDLDQVEVIGSTYGEFDIDQYALLDPDLLIDYSFAGAPLWYVPEAQADQVAEIAPTLGLPGNADSTDDAIDLFVDLAGRLGADTESDALVADREAYTTAQDAAKELAASSDLKVAVVSPSTDSLYVVNSHESPEFSVLEDAGLDYVGPTDPDTGNTFTTLSWEQADQIADADVIFVDARNYDATLDSVKGVDAWTTLPAVEAGQVYPWYASAPYSYKAYAPIYEEFAEDLEGAKAL
jgi:iron complex transport system substrate-binding protein